MKQGGKIILNKHLIKDIIFCFSSAALILFLTFYDHEYMALGIVLAAFFLGVMIMLLLIDPVYCAIDDEKVTMAYLAGKDKKTVLYWREIASVTMQKKFRYSRQLIPSRYFVLAVTLRRGINTDPDSRSPHAIFIPVSVRAKRVIRKYWQGEIEKIKE